MEHAKTGLLINAPSELEEALDELIQNKELRTELAKNWENTVMKNHHWNAVGRQILAFYNHLVHKK
jgi:glycosyltransferase involved in cell wall biosynthesis